MKIIKKVNIKEIKGEIRYSDKGIIQINIKDLTEQNLKCYSTSSGVIEFEKIKED